jgi:hypothetical protein
MPNKAGPGLNGPPVEAAFLRLFLLYKKIDLIIMFYNQ